MEIGFKVGDVLTQDFKRGPFYKVVHIKKKMKI